MKIGMMMFRWSRSATLIHRRKIDSSKSNNLLRNNSINSRNIAKKDTAAVVMLAISRRKISLSRVLMMVESGMSLERNGTRALRNTEVVATLHCSMRRILENSSSSSSNNSLRRNSNHKNSSSRKR